MSPYSSKLQGYGRNWHRPWLVFGRALLITAPLLLTGAPDVRINREGFSRIEGNMHQAQIERIMGAPAGDYTTAPVSVLRPFTCGEFVLDYQSISQAAVKKDWKSDEGFVSVAFDKKGNLVYKSFTPLLWKYDSFLQRVRRRFGL